MKQKDFKIVLYNPEIPGNTGSIGRTCVALGIQLILIRPYGFDLSEKAVRRAGLDYWKYVNIKEYDSFLDFLENEEAKVEQLYFFSRFANKNIFETDLNNNKDKNQINSPPYLIFGSETKGLPKEIFENKNYQNNLISFPSFSNEIRSLNLSNIVTAASYECLRQLNQARDIF